MAGPTDVLEAGSGLMGAEKAAIFLLSIDQDKASAILEELDEFEISKVTNYAARLADVSIEQINGVKQEFVDLLENVNPLALGQTKDQMRGLLKRVLPPGRAEEMSEFLDANMEVQEGLESLKWLDPQTIGGFLRNEHPQTVALVMAHLDPAQAAQVMAHIPQRMQADVIQRLAVLDRISPSVVRDLNDVIKAELLASGATKSSSVGGTEAAAEIINRLEKAIETHVFTRLDEVNPSLADSIRELMFVFEDLIKIDDRDMQQIMREVSNEQLTLSLKTATDEMKEMIFRNISSRAADMIKEELEVMGPVKLSDVEASQQEIVKIARRLESEGKIALGGGGGEALV
jgi:flagellar motor switch protein FliG